MRQGGGVAARAPVLQIRPLERGDIAAITHWARQEGFAPGSGDVAIYRHTDRQGIWVGWLGSERVGCIAGVRYSSAYGFLGLYLVQPQWRGRGYGLQLWRHALEHLADLPCIGLEAALGAFAAGLILSRSRHTEAIQETVKPLVALFATVFFVLIGTGMDLSVLNPLDPANREGLVVAAFLLAVAVVGKLAAGWSYWSAEPTRRLVVGLGMLPRGEVGLIFLGLGSQAGILTPALEAAILLMVIGTTFLAPVLLRLVLAGKSDGPDLDPLAEVPT
ncbi:MAG: GNAT family N-acetyltransferase [Synechococcaceae bacterium WB8_1B_136]|nr:GNAT family N-acetyltransferase [Synechococcaceae bacterium WB8_1B_136]